MRDGLSQWIKIIPDTLILKWAWKKLRKPSLPFFLYSHLLILFKRLSDMNCLLPTGAGTLRPTYLIPMTMVGGTLLDEGHTLIVGFKGFKDFYAHYVADQLKCRGITLSLPDAFHQEMTATALARLMEKKSFRENHRQGD